MISEFRWVKIKRKSGSILLDNQHMMYPRLRLLQKLLAEDGVIFINIGEDEHSNLKLICDEIFSARNYITDFSRQMKVYLMVKLAISA